MKIARSIAIAVLAGGILGAGAGTSVAIAQEVVVPGLAEAIQAQDTTALQALVTANQNNPSVLLQIANALLGAAQGAKNTNPTIAALFAAIAVNTGVLGEGAALQALNIVSLNPIALALLTNPNAPKTGGNNPGDSSGNNNQAQQQNPASNPTQNGSPSH